MPIVEANPSYGDGGKAHSTASSQDGQGGNVSTPDMKSGTRYIYYRLYTRDGPLESKNPIYSNDRFISRILSRLVRPPQTAASLKKYLCKVEGLGPFENCALYYSLSEKTAVENSIRLSFQGTSGPGLSEVDPMAVVGDARDPETSTGDCQKLLEWDYEQRYVYYVIYDEDGGAVSKTSFNENHPFLGRISTLSIPPPRTVSFLKYHLMKCEEISGHNVQIFEDEGSESPMNDNDAIPFLADKFPGFLEDQPIAVTYESQRHTINNEDPNEILARDPFRARSALEELQKSIKTLREEWEKAKETHARELEALDQLKEESKEVKKARELREAGASSAQIDALLARPSFTRKLRANNDSDPTDSRWHSLKTGDILYTDGIPRKENYLNSSTGYDAYLAINSFGKQAFVFTAHIILC